MFLVASFIGNDSLVSLKSYVWHYCMSLGISLLFRLFVSWYTVTFFRDGNSWNLRPIFLSRNSHRQSSYTKYISPSFTLKWQPFIFHSVPNPGKYKENYQIYSYRFERVLYCFACILNPIALCQSTTKGNKIEVKKKHRIDSFRKAQERIWSYWH